MGYRHQIRATWHSYNDGVYFVTICCKDMLHYFGEIHSQRMTLSPAGEIAELQISQLPSHFAYVEVWNHVVMPNHIHLILAIDRHEGVNTVIPGEAGLGCLRPKNHHDGNTSVFHHNSMLSVVVRSLKGGIKRICGKAGIPFEWLPRFHEHIIRNAVDYENIMIYIDNNVEKWQNDCFYAPDEEVRALGGRGVFRKRMI